MSHCLAVQDAGAQGTVPDAVVSANTLGGSIRYGADRMWDAIAHELAGKGRLVPGVR